MNSVTLVGRLTKDPQIQWTKNGKCVAKFTLAVDRQKDEADFIRITAWDKTAELVEKFLNKGRQVAINGRIQTGSYEGKNGTVYTTEVIADRVEFLGRIEDPKEEPKQLDLNYDEAGFEAAEDDLPF